MKRLLLKSFWKKQFTFNNSFEFIMRGLYVIYGGWLFSKALSYLIYDVPMDSSDHLGGAYLIAFLWFLWFAISQASHKSTMKIFEKLINLKDEYIESLQGIYDELSEITNQSIEENKRKDKIIEELKK